MHRLALFVTLAPMLVGLFSVSASADFDTDQRLCNGIGHRSHPDAAIAACTRQISSGRFEGHDLAVSHYNRGLEYHRKGDLDRAIADYNEAIRLDPEYTHPLNNRGAAFHSKKMYDRAIGDYNQAILLDPNYQDALNNRDLSYEAKAETEHAITALPVHSTAKTKNGPTLHTALPALPLTNTKPQVTAQANERRVALVIGNSAYRRVSELPNPNNDAKGIAKELKTAGFTSVRVVTDATRESMVKALRDFQAEADTADWAVVYYAGHGMEIGGVNYLVPTDAQLKEDRDAQDEAVPLNRVLDAVAGSKKLKLVLLDACRENPFARHMKRTIATRAVSRGLTSIEPEGATLVVYAAKDGEVADDGNGDHSPFTAALMRRLRQPGIEINRLFRQVTGDVLQATGNHQRPFVYGSIPGDEEFFFRVQ
jgi:tetratricopeptide (TPR) repeat protein